MPSSYLLTNIYYTNIIHKYRKYEAIETKYELSICGSNPCILTSVEACCRHSVKRTQQTNATRTSYLCEECYNSERFDQKLQFQIKYRTVR